MPNIQNIPTTQYIGPKIVPHFANPSQWDINTEYDALSIVTDGGNTYWAKYNVPAGIDISNTEYWFLSAYPDAQIQAYRQEVQAYAEQVESFDDRITAAQTDATTANTILTGFTTSNKVKPYVDDAIDNVEDYVDNKIEEVKDAIHVVEQSPEIALTEAVFIGDSFTSAYYLVQNGASETDRWCYPVARALHLNPHIYAERGAGYIRNGNIADGGHNFRAMLDVASNDSSFLNSAVKYLFVYGGLNDLDHENAQTAFTTNFSAFCQAARSIFPNANIVVCGINAWPEGFSMYSPDATHKRGQIYYEVIMKGVTNFLISNCTFISMCGALGFNANYYYSDNRHPNTLGNEQIATWIISQMFGTPLCTSIAKKFYTKTDPDTKAGNIQLHMRPGLIEIFGTIPGTFGAENYVMDEFGLFFDQALDLRGCGCIYPPEGQSTTPVIGYLGARDNDSYVHTINYGYFRVVRAF